MEHSSTGRWWPWLALAASIALTAALAQPPQRPQTDGPHQPPLLPRLQFLTTTGASFRSLVTDYFWVQTLQASARARSPEELHDIYDYAKLVIGLDPQFHPIYWFGGIMLPVQDRAGKWHNTAESEELLRLGRQQFPNSYSFGIYLAYDLTTYDHDYLGAAKILDETARIPGAPKYVGALATRLYAQAGKFDAGRDLVEQLYREETDPDTRQMFERRLKQLNLAKLLGMVNGAATEFQRRNGHRPADVAELVHAGLLPGEPVDPMGGQIVLGPDGLARSTVEQDHLQIFGLE